MLPFVPAVDHRPALRRAVLAATVAVALLAAAFAPPARTSGPSVTVLVSGFSSAESAVAGAVQRVGGQVLRRLSIIDGVSARIPASSIDELRAQQGIRSVVPNASVHLKGGYGEGSGVASAVYTDAVKAPDAWAQGWNGAGVGVAVIDTGVNDSGDLAGKVAHAEDFTAEHDGVDHYGHGTFVAGLIAGSGAASGGAVSGVAPGSHLVSVKIAGADGSTDVAKVLAALQWVVTYRDVYGIRVLNLSLGVQSTQDYRIDPLNFAVERVWNAGIVVVAAAGNEGTAPGTVTKPGDDPLVVTAGASDDHTTTAAADDTLATFSGTGPTAAGVAKPDLLAPGKSVVSVRAAGSTVDQAFPGARVGDQYFKGSGTSFSSAVTAGSAALVISRDPSLTPDQVKARLVSSAQPMAGVDPASAGAGELDAWAAASSDAKASANQGVAPARGGGSLQATRGNSCLRSAAGDCLDDASADAAAGFNRAEYEGSQWAGSQWAGSRWTSSQWAGSQWAGSRWTGSQWAGSQWAGSQWAGSQWAGSQWAGSQWAGSQWAGSQWAGSQWAGSQWAGSQWAGSQWAGSQWAGSQWAGSQWAGSQWAGSQWAGSQWAGSQWAGSQWAAGAWG
ncbi:MAG TPA: S8 family serine peptidase [Acidimicrobiales bacterium]|nr:S8 family serine peptidase [Acidimicrobiales bacterium]